MNLSANALYEKEAKPIVKNGDAKSQYQLGLYYQMAKDDDAQALVWYKKSAKQGNKDAILALYLFKEIAILSKKPSSIKSEINSIKIEMHHLKVTNIEENEHFKFILKKANTGDSLAQYQLGLIYENGYGTKTNTKKALKWYDLASKHGSKEATLAYKLLKEAL